MPLVIITANSRARDMTMIPPINHIRARFHMEMRNKVVFASFT